MRPTSISLIDRLRNAASDSPDWRRLHDLYFPLIQSWLLRVPEIGHEAADLVQEVLLVLVRELPSFERQRDGAFRSWLRQITLNRIRAFQKTRRKRPLAGAGGKSIFCSRSLKTRRATSLSNGTATTTNRCSRNCLPLSKRTSSRRPGRRLRVSPSTSSLRRGWPENWECPKERSSRPSTAS